MRKTAKLFMTGRSQAVRLPKEFRFEGDEVEISRDPVTGDVLLKPRLKQVEDWDAFFMETDRLKDDGRIPHAFLLREGFEAITRPTAFADLDDGDFEE
jgi:antitoxin VapB